MGGVGGSGFDSVSQLGKRCGKRVGTIFDRWGPVSGIGFEIRGRRLVERGVKKSIVDEGMSWSLFG